MNQRRGSVVCCSVNVLHFPQRALMGSTGRFPWCRDTHHGPFQTPKETLSGRGVRPFGVSGPHWNKKSFWGLTLNTLTKTDEQKQCFKLIYGFVLGHIHSHPGPHAGRGLDTGAWVHSQKGTHSLPLASISTIQINRCIKPQEHA